MEHLKIKSWDFKQLHSFRYQKQRDVYNQININAVAHLLNTEQCYPVEFARSIAQQMVTSGSRIICNCGDECDCVEELSEINTLTQTCYNTTAGTALCIKPTESELTVEEEFIFNIYPKPLSNTIVRKANNDFNSFLTDLDVHLSNHAKCGLNAAIILLNDTNSNGVLFGSEFIQINTIESYLCQFLNGKVNHCPISIDLILKSPENEHELHISMLESENPVIRYIVSE